MKKLLGSIALAAVVMTVGGVTTADAAFVTFNTSGKFTSTGTNTVTTGTGTPVTITFNGAGDNLFTPSLTNFGNFVTSGGNGNFTDIDFADTFTLTINQTLPGVGNTTFPAELHGQLRIFQSQAYVLFTDIGPNYIGDIGYRIVERDNNTPGRANLNAPQAGGSDSLPSGVEGEVIPEPASLLMLGSGLLGLAMTARRRARR